MDTTQTVNATELASAGISYQMVGGVKDTHLDVPFYECGPCRAERASEAGREYYDAGDVYPSLECLGGRCGEMLGVSETRDVVRDAAAERRQDERLANTEPRMQNRIEMRAHYAARAKALKEARYMRRVLPAMALMEGVGTEVYFTAYEEAYDLEAAARTEVEELVENVGFTRAEQSGVAWGEGMVDIAKETCDDPDRWAHVADGHLREMQADATPYTGRLWRKAEGKQGQHYATGEVPDFPELWQYFARVQDDKRIRFQVMLDRVARIPMRRIRSAREAFRKAYGASVERSVPVEKTIRGIRFSRPAHWDKLMLSGAQKVQVYAAFDERMGLTRPAPAQPRRKRLVIWRRRMTQGSKPNYRKLVA
jgi:hypothetical protein